MKKIMFNDRYGLTQAVLEGRFRQRMEINVLGITNTLTSVGKDNMAYIEYE